MALLGVPPTRAPYHLLFFSAMVSTRSSVSNANDAHANNVDADNNANANADDANDANANDADAADKADDDPFPVLTGKDSKSPDAPIGKFGVNVRLILTPHFLFPLPSWLDRRTIYEHT